MVAPARSMSGLNGWLNAISDRQHCGYPCTDTFGANGDQAQLVPFDLTRRFEVGDAQGVKFEIFGRVISGRPSLLECRRLASKIGAAVSEDYQLKAHEPSRLAPDRLVG